MISGITAGSLTDRQISRQIGIAGSLEPHGTIQSHRIHGAAIICYIIYGNIYHQYTPNVSIYIPYMDPIGNGADYSKARSVLSVEREDIGSEN